MSSVLSQKRKAGAAEFSSKLKKVKSQREIAKKKPDNWNSENSFWWRFQSEYLEIFNSTPCLRSSDQNVLNMIVEYVLPFQEILNRLWVLDSDFYCLEDCTPVQYFTSIKIENLSSSIKMESLHDFSVVIFPFLIRYYDLQYEDDFFLQKMKDFNFYSSGSSFSSSFMFLETVYTCWLDLHNKEGKKCTSFETEKYGFIYRFSMQLFRLLFRGDFGDFMYSIFQMLISDSVPKNSAAYYLMIDMHFLTVSEEALENNIILSFFHNSNSLRLCVDNNTPYPIWRSFIENVLDLCKNTSI